MTITKKILDKFIELLDVDKKYNKKEILNLLTKSYNDIYDIIEINKSLEYEKLDNENYNKSIEIIDIIKSEKNKEILKNCIYIMKKNSKIYPPRKNEYKFIYGKLGELNIIETFEKCGLNIIDLDKLHNIGSEYLNDISIDNIKYSIKLKLNKRSDITIINCKSTYNHNLKINTIIVVINEYKLYIIPDNFDTNNFIKYDKGSISYKSSILSHIDKYYNYLVYTFPKLTDLELKNINTYECKNDFYINLFNNLKLI